MVTNNTNEFERSTTQLLQDISAGIIDAKTLDKTTRQRCIELLVTEGYTYQHISQVFKISEKTVSRDMKEIRSQNKLTPNIEFAKETAGELFRHGLNHHAYMMRVARSKDATNSEKIAAEFSAWRILRELVERMQSLGYLPLKPQEITGDFYHHIASGDGQETIVKTREMLAEIESIAKDTDTYTPELIEQIKILNTRINKDETVLEVKKLKDSQEQQISKKEGNENEQ